MRTKHIRDAVDQIGNVEELNVPTRHDIRKVATRLPDLQEVAKKVPLILALDVVNAIGWCVILHAKQHLLTLTTEGDSGYFLVCLFNVGESVGRISFDVDTDDIDLRRVILHIAVKLIIHEDVLEIC